MSDYTGLNVDPYAAKTIFLFGFLGTMAFLSSYALRETKRQGPLELTEEGEEMRKKHNDPRRPPWPLLHQRVVLLRENKVDPEDLPLLWEQTKYYYPHDWLIPLELAQVLKYSSGTFLKHYVPDPEALRKEILMQLLDVKYGRVKDPNGGRINRDVQEIISIAAEDLENLDMRVDSSAVLVPRNT